MRAWQNRDRFEQRASIQTWLYRIATNVCLDALRARARRTMPAEAGPAGTLHDALEPRTGTHWLEPIPDERALAADASPFELAALRQSIRLAFVAALQRLPPRQRAALLLTDVLGWSAAEAAETLETSVPAVNSAIQRARATLAASNAGTADQQVLTEREGSLLDRYVSAFEAYDIIGLQSLLREDAVFSMPPYALWLRGRDAIGGWLTGRGVACRGSRLVPIRACGSVAFGQYKPDAEGRYSPWAVVLLERDRDAITGWHSFLDTAALFPLFGLPMILAGQGRL